MLKSKRVRGILQLLVSLLLLVWLVGRVGLNEIANVLTGIDWSWYLLAFFFFLVNVVLRTYRWYILINALGEQLSFWQLLYLYFLGFFFNNFIPTGFGGDVVKVVSLYREHGRGVEALSSVVMDRLTGLTGSSLIALVVLVWRSVETWLEQPGASIILPPALVASVAVVSVGTPLGFALLRWGDPLGRLSSLLPFTGRFTTNDRVQRLAGTVQRYPLATLGQALLTSLPFTLGLVVSQYTIAQALSVEVPFHLFLLFVPVISVVNLLPLSLNGLGMREGVYQLLFVPVGVSAAAAIAMSLAFYFLRVSTGFIGGVLYALRGVSGLRQASHAEDKGEP